MHTQETALLVAMEIVRSYVNSISFPTAQDLGDGHIVGEKALDGVDPIRR